MNFTILRTAAAAALAILLTACGGAPADDMAQGSVQTGLATTRALVGTPSADAGITVTATVTATTAAGNAASVTVAAATTGMPVADCAADGCNGPRIIDGNAEAARYAAMLRAADTPQT